MKAPLADRRQPMRTTPAEFGKLMAEETDKWAKVIRTAGIKPVADLRWTMSRNSVPRTDD